LSTNAWLEAVGEISAGACAGALLSFVTRPVRFHFLDYSLYVHACMLTIQSLDPSA